MVSLLEAGSESGGPRRLLRGFQFHPPSRKTAAWAVAVGPFSQTRGLSDLSPAL